MSITPHRNGFTVIEIVVALFVFSVGALALAATSAVIAREMTTNSLRERSALVSANRLEIIRSQCAPSAGKETGRGITSSWSAGPSLSGELSAEAIVKNAGRQPRTYTYQVTMACAQ